MSKPKLIHALNTLAKEEWSSYRRYILMYTNPTSDIFKLFLILQKNKTLHKRGTDLETIRSSAFNNITSKSFLNLFSKLFQWFEEWLILYHLKIETKEKSLILTKLYNDRGLFNLADQTANKLKKTLQKNKKWNLRDDRILKDLLHTQYYSDNPIKYREGADLLTALLNNHLEYFKNQSLIYWVELINWGNIQNHDYTTHITLLQNCCNLITDSSFSEILMDLQKMIQEDQAAFRRVKDQLLDGKFDINSEIHTITVIYLLFALGKLSGKGALEESNTITEIYNYALESGALLTDNKIPIIRFHNIIASLGVHADATMFESHLAFIDKWIDYVETPLKESSKALAIAQTCFYCHKYHLIRDHLIGKEFHHLDQKVRAFRLEIVGLFYEREKFYDLFYLLLTNYKRFLSRNKKKLSKKYFQANYNLIVIIELLARRDFKETKIDVNKYQYLEWRNWVETQL